MSNKISKKERDSRVSAAAKQRDTRSGRLQLQQDIEEVDEDVSLRDISGKKRKGKAKGKQMRKESESSSDDDGDNDGDHDQSEDFVLTKARQQDSKHRDTRESRKRLKNNYMMDGDEEDDSIAFE